MKVAVCISGQNRYWKIAFPYINENIIKPNNADVFFHCWHNKDQIGKEYQHPNCEKMIIEDDIDEMISTYKPKDYTIESQKLNLSPRPIDEYKTKNTASEANPFIQFSMFYSWKKSVDLKCEYENTYKFYYNIVFHIRFDCIPLSPIIAQDYNLDLINATNSCRNPMVMSDLCVWSKNQNMNAIAFLYDNIDHYWNDDNILMCGENMLTWHLHKLGMVYNKVNIGLFIARDKDLKIRQWGIEY